MTDNLLLAGRCRYPRKLEADLWAREAVFSTGLVLASPFHTTNPNILSSPPSSVARLPPVRWGDDDAQFIIMLTLNKRTAGDQHMRIFSRLAPTLCEEFRNALVSAASTDAIASLLQHELNFKGMFCMELYLDTANVAEVERLARSSNRGCYRQPNIVAAKTKESIWDVLPPPAKRHPGERDFVCPNHEPRCRQHGRRRVNIKLEISRSRRLKVPVTI